MDVLVYQFFASCSKIIIGHSVGYTYIKTNTGYRLCQTTNFFQIVADMPRL